MADRTKYQRQIIRQKMSKYWGNRTEGTRQNNLVT
jgi:hypothetical protein